MKITGRKSANHAGSEIGWVSTLHFSLTVYLWRCTARKTKNASEMVSMISLQWPSSFSGAGKNHPQGWWINTPVKRNHFQAPKLEGPGIMIFWKSSFTDMIRIYILYKYVWYIWIIYQNTIISRRTFVQFSASRLPPPFRGPPLPPLCLCSKSIINLTRWHQRPLTFYPRPFVDALGDLEDFVGMRSAAFNALAGGH